MLQRDDPDLAFVRLWQCVFGGAVRGCLARILGALVAGQRGEDDVQVAVAEHLGGRIRLAIEGDVLDELVHHLEADFLVRLLAPVEAQLDADFEVLAEELDGVVALDGQVVRVNGRRRSAAPSSGWRIVGAGVFVPLGFLVEEFAVIHDAADGRRGVGGNLDQVQTFALGQAKGFVEGHDAQLLLGFVDDPDFAGADLPVAAMQGFAGTKGAREGAAQRTPAG